MTKEDEKTFRVVDKRFSSGSEQSKEPPQKTPEAREGEGFVMREVEKQSEPQAFEMDFSTLIFSLATGALIHMGLSPDPATKKTQKNPDLAKQNIDILAILKEKTKGNLTSDEEKLLESLLTEIRLKFVETSR